MIIFIKILLNYKMRMKNQIIVYIKIPSYIKNIGGDKFGYQYWKHILILSTANLIFFYQYPLRKLISIM